MDVVERLQGVKALSEEELRDLGEAVRDEAERIVRTDPSQLQPLLERLRSAGRRCSHFQPWTLWAEGMAEHGRGNPAVAVGLLRRASQWFRRRGDSHTAARVDLPLMDALACMGRHRDAVRRGRQAFAVFTAHGDRGRMVSALLNLGCIAETRDRMRDALAFWQRARRLVDPGDLLRSALIEANLANGAHSLGRFHQALALYEKAAQSYEDAGAPASALKPRLGIAEVSALLGNVGQALSEASSIESTAERCQDYNPLIDARLFRCRTELDLGHLDQASLIADHNRQLCKQHGRLDDAARFLMLRLLAAVRTDEPQLAEREAEAEHELRRTGLGVLAAAMRVELAGVRRTASTTSLLRDAALLHQAGVVVQADLARVRCAGELVELGETARARRLCKQVLQRRHVSVWPRIEAHCIRAESSVADDPAGALKDYRRAVQLSESVRGRLGSESDRRAVTARTARAYERLVELLLRKGDSRSRRQAFDLVSRVKSRSLLESLDRRRDLEWRDSPELVSRWNDMRQELAAMLAAIEGRPGEHSRYSTAVVKQRIREISQQMEAIEQEVARSVPVLGAVLGHLQVPRLRSLLRPGELYLELFFTGQDLVVFELDSSRLRVHRRQGARQQVEQQVRAVQFQLSKAAFGRRYLEHAGDQLVTQVRASLAALGEQLLGCLRDRPSPQLLYVAPHDVLHHLPFTALELDGRPVLCSCPVSIVPGSSVLAHLLQRPHRQPLRLGIAGAAQAELAEIDHEVTDIQRRFPDARAVPGAAMADVCALLEQCDAVHVASHGAFQPLFPAGSGVRLGDGWLTALDLLRTPITASLVSFGACASGQVAVMPGEELDGLVRALLAAGVQSAVLAPGALDDQIARQVAGLFYDRVLTDGPGQALRQALLSVREHHPHPALWAALQLYGNPRPWEEES